MMIPSRVLQPICRVAAAAPLCAAPSQHLVEFQIADATPANLIQASQGRFVLPHETLGVAGTKNVCNQVRSPKRNLLQRSQVLRFAECETAGDLPFPLLVRAIARVREALRRGGREA